jgi:hypothetical protein
MARRGCGTREAGGVYLCVGLSKYGRPVEDFIVDYPVDVFALNLSALGMHEFGGNLYDWVGEAHYPTPAHFVEEVRHQGLSRKISPNFPFQKLSEIAMHYLVHPRALVENHAAYPREIRPACPRGLHEDGPCACLWYVQQRDGKGGAEAVGDGTYGPLGVRDLTVTLPDGVHGFLAGELGVSYPAMQTIPAVFMQFPITKIEIVNHRDQALVAERRARAERSGLPVEIVEE